MYIQILIIIIMIIGTILILNKIRTLQYIYPNMVKQGVLLIFMIISLYICKLWFDLQCDEKIYNCEGKMLDYKKIFRTFNKSKGNEEDNYIVVINNELNIGVDNISIYLLILTIIILPISILSNWKNIITNNKFINLNNEKNINIKTYKNNMVYQNVYYILILILGILLIINYMCMNILLFYIIFELTLIPLFLIITIYGSSNKEKAGYYLLMYTLSSSLFMLCSIILTNIILENTSYLVYTQYVISLDIQMLLWVGIMIGMVVKIPLYPFHAWLPLVHSESPLGCSIILAGIILKLTIYLILRWILPFLPEANFMLAPIMYIICIITIIVINLMILVQLDLKIIIAYSSICHMGICILGLFSNSITGLKGGYILGICHGFISPGLFIAVGGILYDRFNTRLLYYYKGLLEYKPVFSFYFLLLSLANIGTPLSGNFIGEFLSLNGTFQYSPIISTIASISILLSASYQMKLVNRILHGNVYIYIISKLDNNNLFNNDDFKFKYDYMGVKDLTHRETFLFLMTIVPVIIVGIYPNFLIKVPMLDLIYNAY